MHASRLHHSNFAIGLFLIAKGFRGARTPNCPLSARYLETPNVIKFTAAVSILGIQSEVSCDDMAIGRFSNIRSARCRAFVPTRICELLPFPSLDV